MNENIIHIGYLATAYLLLFTSAELLYHKLNIQVEVTRKYVHIVTGILSLLFPLLLNHHLYVLLLTSSFLIILVLSLKYNLLNAINGIERKSRGSILYPIIVYGSFLVYQHYDHLSFYYIPIVILAICDPVAAFVGKKWTKLEYTTFGKKKTLTGSFGFFVVALVLSVVLLINMENIVFYKALVIGFSVSLATAVAEALTHKGYDNITIPGVAILVLVLFESIGYL